jgi:hypothetical protein
MTTLAKPSHMANVPTRLLVKDDTDACRREQSGHPICPHSGEARCRSKSSKNVQLSVSNAFATSTFNKMVGLWQVWSIFAVACTV